MNNEFVFSDLYKLALNKEKISEKFEPQKWRAIDYEAGEYTGKMLVAAENEFPGEITLEFNLEGEYDIYICLPKFSRANYLYIKLSDEDVYTGVRPTEKTPTNWSFEEYFEEVYFKSADLTGKSLKITKPCSASVSSVTALAWIRCVPKKSDCSEYENKCVQMHIDIDYSHEDSFERNEDYLIRLQPLKISNVDFVSLETTCSFGGYKKDDRNHIYKLYYDIEKARFDFIKNAEFIYKQTVSYAHENNIKIYAAERSSLSNFVTPADAQSYNIKFVDDNPQFYCVARNGKKLKICSYAYEEVQDFVINHYLDMLKFGFDGITLIMIRGIHIGFEKPVLELFHKLYPDVGPGLLPYSDERLHNVLCSFMNKFMEKLRKAVDDKFPGKKINVITDYSLKTSKHFGLDVEYWAKAGLIDSVSQGDMEIVENLDGCLSDDGLIDMEKYNKALRERAVISRNYATNVDKVCKHIGEYMKLKEQYGVGVYNVLPWARDILPEEYDGVVEKMKKAGAEKFLSFNTTHLIWDLPEWYTLSSIGNKKPDAVLRKFHRVISLDGNDICQFHPNWRG